MFKSLNEGEVEELKEEMKLSRQGVPAGIVTADADEFAEGDIYGNIEVEGGELRIWIEDKSYNAVRAGRFDELVDEVAGRLVGDGVVVVVGPKGIGKSTLAAAVIWELLSKHEVGCAC